ncbi:MAG TPA: NCS2 family permease [Myxococcota bacterium]|nr:NCS2 family permease [Myxococcota bacterium]
MLLESVFHIKERGSTVRREVSGGLTTFITLAYIIVVNPAILEAAGIPKDASMAATIFTAFIGTMIMGVWANRPFAIAPYMGENAFVAFTVVKVLGFSWQTALGAIFLSGFLFSILTVLGVRKALVQSIPMGLKSSFALGIGLFLAFVGFNEIGLVRLGVPGAPVTMGDVSSLPVVIGIATTFLMAVLMYWKVPGAILLAILGGATAAFATGVAPWPGAIVSSPPSMAATFMQFDLKGAMSLSFLNVVLVVFVMDFVDTMGTLIGLSARAGMLDRDGNLPQIERPMLADALSTVVAAILGTTTAGIFIESAAGIEAGARTGLAAVVTALLFLVALFFWPLLTAMPACAYGPALIIVGGMMLQAVSGIEIGRMDEFLPAFLVVVLMAFTYNIGIGMTAGFVAWPIMKIAAGKWRQVMPGMWVLAAISMAFFVFHL